jgi:osmotically-inducible protein OsmY
MKIRVLLAMLTVGGILATIFVPLTLAGQMEDESTKGTEQQSDLWLKAKLVTTYTLNQNLNPFDIDVDVKNGVVTLGGKVDSSVEKDLAVEIAKGTSGVKEVRDELAIESEAGAPQKEKANFSRKVNDATITAKVKSRLLWNRNVEGLHIEVDTDHGEVVLSGRTDSTAKRDLAVQIARNTSGVRKVVDHLQVSANAPDTAKDTTQGTGEKIGKEVSDAWITGKVKAILLASSEAEGADIEVSTRNKVVTLSGTVKSKEQESRVKALVADVVGVQEVKTELTTSGN